MKDNSSKNNGARFSRKTHAGPVDSRHASLSSPYFSFYSRMVGARPDENETAMKSHMRTDSPLDENRLFVEEDYIAGSDRSHPVHWSVAWSDLMMTMFVFFIIMFAFHSSRVTYRGSMEQGSEIGSELGKGILGKGGGGGALGELPSPMEESIEKIYDLSRLTLEKNDMGGFASVELVPDKAVRIVLTGDLLFDSGKADLKESAKRSLGNIAEVLLKTPYMVNVVGHTDDVPIRSGNFPSNWELSLSRAAVVTRFLIEEDGVAAERFYVTGHSYYFPLRPNNTPENRAANRRVEIVITKDKPVISMAGDMRDVFQYAGVTL